MAWRNSQDLVAKEPTDSEVRQVEDYIRRKAKPRFYADENFPTIATEILRQRGANVLTVQDAGRQRHPDENHAAESLRLRRVLITCDRDYLDDGRFPLIHCPAMVVCDFGRGTAREIQATFNCLWSVFAAPQFYDKWVKIAASHDCWTEHTRFLDGTTAHRRFRVFGGRLQEWCDDEARV
jgi:predicted nuclease of predicted toxin-antitoxin system